MRPTIAILSAAAFTLCVSLSSVNAAQEEKDSGIYLDSNYFDTSLPATYERCQDTVKMEQYLNSLGANDVDKLKKFNAFLIGCQALLQDRIAKTKEQVSKLEQERNQAQ